MSNKILVQNNNEIYETTHLNICGAATEFKIYGNNIQIEHVNRAHKELIGKSVKIGIKGAASVITPIKSTYIFSEEFKKLNPVGYITSINGASNKFEVRL